MSSVKSPYDRSPTYSPGDVPIDDMDSSVVDEIVGEFEPFTEKENVFLDLRNIKGIRHLHVGLTPKEIRFAYNYIIYKDESVAAERSGFYNPQSSSPQRDTSIAGSRLLRKKAVRGLVHALELRAAALLSIDADYVVCMASTIAEDFNHKAKDRIEALKLISRVKGFEIAHKMVSQIDQKSPLDDNSTGALSNLMKVFQEQGDKVRALDVETKE